MDASTRARLRTGYRETIPAKLADLQVARQDLVDGRPHAPEQIQRLAHDLASSGASHGFANISLEANRVEQAAPDDLLAALDQLIEVLRGVSHSEREVVARALIIEDDLATAQLVRDAMQPLFGEVHIAVTATAARGLLAVLNFDVIVLDLFLPDADGRDLLVELRSEIRSARIPVIVLTGARAGHRVRRECIELGVEHYIDKPIDLETAVAVVHATLDRRSRWLQETRSDWLTGLRNRAGFHEALGMLHSLAQRSGQPLCLARLDIDQLQRINDEYGYPAGDQILTRLASLLRVQLHPHHVPSRWGSDELMVALPNTTAAEGKALLDQVLDALRRESFGDPGPEGVTFSAGIVEVTESLDRAIFELDRRVYAAKLLGRARVIHTFSVDEPEHRILVVDDDPVIVTLVEGVLGEEARVDVAADGAEALQKIDHVRYAAIILDWMLPDTTGDALLTVLRDRPKTRHTPVLMLTSLGDEKSVERAFDLGADDYMQKPFRVRELAARVRRLLLRDRPRPG